ncbi:MAG: hypothetical protein HY508_10125 [Acidobacteria bacterium]|nr:hypothetical protein [Acidobacteriota bacterium]
MANPKIVYTPEGGAEQTLNFALPPREVPAYQKTAVRHDNVSAAGIRESVLERTDEFLEFTMDFIKAGTDLANWQAFLDYALAGAAFAYYPDASLGASTNYLLEDTELLAARQAPGAYTLRLKMRKQIL